MTVQLDWPREIVDRLTDEARKNGSSLGDYVLNLLPAPNGAGAAKSDEGIDDEKRKTAGNRILEIQTRVKPDPEGLTSRDYISQGRR
jgi:hypothetical protein